LSQVGRFEMEWNKYSKQQLFSSWLNHNHTMHKDRERLIHRLNLVVHHLILRQRIDTAKSFFSYDFSRYQVFHGKVILIPAVEILDTDVGVEMDYI